MSVCVTLQKSAGGAGGSRWGLGGGVRGGLQCVLFDCETV